MATPDPSPTSFVSLRRWRDGSLAPGRDAVVVEEPLEYRIRGEPIATVMRTPGDDIDLAIGFFFAEGFLSDHRDIGAICLGARVAGGESGDVEVALVDLTPSDGALARAAPDERRHGPMVSSCGVCGKRMIEEVLATVPDSRLPAPGEPVVDGATIATMPDALRRRQPVFGETGALHAAGLFDFAGNAIEVAEDIGRHNAVDKVIGRRVRAGRLPLDSEVLVVSGRASFEITQKALRASIPVVVAVSGVSNLAVDLAERGGVTLCGFTRDRSFCVYAHPGRIRE